VSTAVAGATALRAEFLQDITIPDRCEVVGAQTLVKTWRVANAGLTQWPIGTSLRFLRGDNTLLVQHQFQVPYALPGQEVDVSALIQTPTVPGRYTAFFRLCGPQGKSFGPRMWVNIIVVNKQQTAAIEKDEAVTQPPVQAVELVAPIEKAVKAVSLGVETTHQEVPHNVDT